jgi:His-Xaa-Ser system radical SAM maturase HxsB
VLITNDAGEYLVLQPDEHAALMEGRLPPDGAVFEDLLAKHMAHEGTPGAAMRLLATKARTRKAFMRHGPSLHILVPSLRCHQSCLYCQVSRRPAAAPGFDMSMETASAAIDRILESDSPDLTIEFQGGEPLLAFDTIQWIMETVKARAADRLITFSMTSTLHHLTPERAEILRQHDVRLSASLDGPAEVHDANRPLPGGDAFARTMQGVELARRVLGRENIAAITTVTRRGLAHPEAMVDALVGLGFQSLFLRPISPYGFATRTAHKIGYPLDDFLAFYRAAMARILELNRTGTVVEEAYAGVLLQHILTPFHSGYVDLRSPAGAGLGVLVYDYDGAVYASDEGRMLAATGDATFRMGTVHDSLSTLLASDAMRHLARGSVAEEQPGCRDCAFLPYCGADPVHHHAVQGNVAAERLSSDFCRRHRALFGMLFTLLEDGDASTRRTLTRWAMARWNTGGASA